MKVPLKKMERGQSGGQVGLGDGVSGVATEEANATHDCEFPRAIPWRFQNAYCIDHGSIALAFTKSELVHCQQSIVLIVVMAPNLVNLPIVLDSMNGPFLSLLSTITKLLHPIFAKFPYVVPVVANSIEFIPPSISCVYSTNSSAFALVTFHHVHQLVYKKRLQI